jgi:microcystin-dependent protein
MQAAPYLGEIKAFAGTGSSIPSGWLLCDGQTLSISSNEALFSLLGTTFGGDGRSTFALPNLEDRTVASLGTNDTLGQTYGANTAPPPASRFENCYGSASAAMKAQRCKTSLAFTRCASGPVHLVAGYRGAICWCRRIMPCCWMAC